MKRIILIMIIIGMFVSAHVVTAGDTTPPANPAMPQQEGSVVPGVVPTGVDFGIVGGYRYMRVTGSDVPVHAAPSERSRVLRRYEGGYDFVTPRGEAGDWTEINPGEWVQTRFLTEVYASYFTGAVIESEPNVPWGWVLVSHHASASPGGPEVLEDSYRVQKYQMTNFFETAVVDGWRWYNIGDGRWVRQTMVSKVQRVANPGLSGRWVAIDLYEQNLVAYEGDRMVFATLVASGRPGNDTNTGVFNIWASNRMQVMDGERGGFGDYRLENVPYAMYFDGDISLHGTYWHNGFGYRQSRGCVNVTISDARWLYEWLPSDAGVYVYYSQSY
ncbi:MAG: L,D-transpeptidase [Anaerolineales bacterium]